MIEAKTGNIAKTQAIEELLARGIASGTMTGQSTKPAPKRKTGKVIETKVAEAFAFELRDCKRSGKSVTCHFMIRSNEQDIRSRKIFIFSLEMLTGWLCLLFQHEAAPRKTYSQTVSGNKFKLFAILIQDFHFLIDSNL